MSSPAPTLSSPVAGNSPSPSQQATASPASPSAQLASGPYAVVGGPGDNAISLVTSTGLVVASSPVTPAPFRAHALMSWTSASQTRLYFLDAGSEVRFLAPDAGTGTATRITLGSNQQAGFAVSPDDRLIAVAILSYTPPPANPNGFAGYPAYDGMRMYVEDLQGGGHHVDIFSSTTVAEFPIGWTSGRLVVAVGDPLCCQARPLNPYAATSYHVVDPATGTRLASLCDKTGGPAGPVVSAGALCIESGASPLFQRWDGSPFPAPAAIPDVSQYLAALSADGTRVAVGGDPIRIMGPAGRDDAYAGESGYVFGWLDARHVAFQRPGDGELWMLDLNTRRSQVISGTTTTPSGGYLGVFPAATA
ncbi:MAG: hypothetical protein ACYDB4_07500 [Candidatus Dormibacteraceae bacterium]